MNVNTNVLKCTRNTTGSRVPDVNNDLNFLVLKYLEDKVDPQTFQNLTETLTLGSNSALSNFPRSFSHITPDYLLLICKRALQLSDLQVPNGVAKVNSLLGTGRFSLLRTKKEANFIDWNYQKLVATRNDAPIIPPVTYTRPVNIANVIRARSMSTNALTGFIQSPHVVFGKMKQLTRVLGHLMHVYCCSFDKTATRIFTGADDGLIKCWEASSGRLLCSFRGFEAEVADVLTNQENTLLAAGGNDSTVRVWDLHTTEPVAVLKGHGGLLSSIEFSPWLDGDKRYLASTALDGTLCIWPHVGKNFDFAPIVFSEKDKPSSQTLCLSFSPGGALLVTGNSEHLLRIYHFSPSGAVCRIAEINAHNDKIDSIEFSHSGDRFMSGSRDGTAKIWSLNKVEVDGGNHQWVFNHIVLNVNHYPLKEDKKSHKFSDDAAKANKMRVLMVAWDLEDQRVYTSASDFSIHMWDPSTGNHMALLHGHQDEAYVIQPHPYNSRILLSGSHDGYLIIWDCLTCQPIRKFFNQMEGQGFSSIFDCKWSPDGLSIAATDAFGQLLIIGHGDDSLYREVVYEQFFHTDYRPLLWDERGVVLDEQTRIAPHLMVPPFLVNGDGTPYPPDKQKFVPGRENLDAPLQIAVTNRTDEGPLRVISGVSALDSMIERLATQQRQNGILSPENAAPSTSATVAASRGANLPHVPSSISPTGGGANFLSPLVASHLDQIRSSYMVWLHRKLAPPLSARTVLANARMRKRMYINDVSHWHPTSIRRQFRREMRIRENRETTARLREVWERQAPFARVATRPSAATRPSLSSTTVTPVSAPQTSSSRRRAVVAPLDSSPLPTTNSNSRRQSSSNQVTRYNGAVGNDSSFLANEDSNLNTDVENMSTLSINVSNLPSSVQDTLAEEDRNRSKLVAGFANGELSNEMTDDDDGKDKKQQQQQREFVIEDSNDGFLATKFDVDKDISDQISEDGDADDDEISTTSSTSSSPDEENEIEDDNEAYGVSSESSYEGMYGSDDPDFDMNRLRRAGANMDDLMPVSYSAVARKKVLKLEEKKREQSAVRHVKRSKKRKRKRPRAKHEVELINKSGKNQNKKRGVKRRKHRSLSDTDGKSKKRMKYKDESLSPQPHNSQTKRRRKPMMKFLESDTDNDMANNMDANTSAKLPSSFIENHNRIPKRSAAKHAQLAVSEHTPFFSEWVTDTVAHKTPYVPQMGDQVYFLPAAHVYYRNRVEFLGLYLLQEFCPAVDLPNSLKHSTEVFGQIVDISYKSVPTYPNKSVVSLDSRTAQQNTVSSYISLCTATIVPLLEDLSQSPCNQPVPGVSPFTVTWHDLEHIADCITLHNFVQQAISRNWQVGNRFKTPLEDKWYFGTINDIHAERGVFNCIDVTFDTGETDTVSMWDLEPLTPSEISGQISINKKGTIKNPYPKVDFLPEDELQFQYKPLSGEWGDSDRDIEMERIRSCLLQLVDEKVAEQFGAPVDLSEFPTYIQHVAYPTDLLTIKQRLENRFYRRLMAITWEIDLIAQNAEKFNYPTAPIVANARIVTAILKFVVRDPTITDAKPVIARMRDTLILNPKIDLTSQLRSSKFDCSWKNQCLCLLRQLLELPDSAHVRESVVGESPGSSCVNEDCGSCLRAVAAGGGGSAAAVTNNSTVDCCSASKRTRSDCSLNLLMILSKLNQDVYEDPLQFANDIRYVISESKSCNASKKSRTKAMAIRLSGIFEENFQAIFEDYKQARRYYENVNYGARVRNVFMCQIQNKQSFKAKRQRREGSSIRDVNDSISSTQNSETEQDDERKVSNLESIPEDREMVTNNVTTARMNKKDEVLQQQSLMDATTDENDVATGTSGDELVDRVSEPVSCGETTTYDDDDDSNDCVPQTNGDNGNQNDIDTGNRERSEDSENALYECMLDEDLSNHISQYQQETSSCNDDASEGKSQVTVEMDDKQPIVENKKANNSNVLEDNCGEDEASFDSSHSDSTDIGEEVKEEDGDEKIEYVKLPVRGNRKTDQTNRPSEELSNCNNENRRTLRDRDYSYLFKELSSSDDEYEEYFPDDSPSNQLVPIPKRPSSRDKANSKKKSSGGGGGGSQRSSKLNLLQSFPIASTSYSAPGWEGDSIASSKTSTNGDGRGKKPARSSNKGRSKQRCKSKSNSKVSAASVISSQRSSTRIATSRSLHTTHMYYYESDDFSDF